MRTASRRAAIFATLCLCVALGALACAAPAAAARSGPGSGAERARAVASGRPEQPFAGRPEARAAQPRRVDPRRVERLRERARAGALAIDFDIGVVKLALVGGALALLLLGWRLRAIGRPERLGRTRRIALLVVAVTAFAAHYNFFLWRHYDGIHAHEVFHYYLGPKYFPELGYTGLYECAVAAATQGRPALTERRHVIRDLRDIQRRIPVRPADWGPRCNESFTAGRWRQFRGDVLWLKARLPGPLWERVITDQGFNASPVWVLFGRPLASIFPAEADAMRRLVRIDLVLVLVTFAAVAWAFGFEGFCLALIAWSVSPLSRYQWVGDSVARQLWFASSMGGLCLLARRRAAGAGALLATSALLRVFPVFFALGFLARQLRRWWVERRFDAGLRRFLVGAVATGLVLLVMASWVCGRGPGVFREFAGNMATYSSLTARNSIGLRPLLSFTTRRPAPFVVDGQLRLTDRSYQELYEKTFAARRPIYLAAVALFLVLFWRALGRARGWEAAALGFTLIPVLSQPASYYMTCTVAAALLGASRPRIACALLIALTAWCATALYYFGDPLRYPWFSAVALLFSLFVLAEMRRRGGDDAARAPAAGGDSIAAAGERR